VRITSTTEDAASCMISRAFMPSSNAACLMSFHEPRSSRDSIAFWIRLAAPVRKSAAQSMSLLHASMKPISPSLGMGLRPSTPAKPSGLLAPSAAAHHQPMSTKSRESIYGSSIRASAERAKEARKNADRLACEAWNQRMLG
jgi:hypothetical protein